MKPQFPALASAALAALVAMPAAAQTDVVLRTEVTTLQVNAGAGGAIEAVCETGETALAASFLAEEPDSATPEGFRRARGVYAEGWRSGPSGWRYELVNTATSRALRLTLTLTCYRGAVEEVRVEN